jgi:hypothetical protein
MLSPPWIPPPPNRPTFSTVWPALGGLLQWTGHGDEDGGGGDVMPSKRERSGASGDCKNWVEGKRK